MSTSEEMKILIQKKILDALKAIDFKEWEKLMKR